MHYYTYVTASYIGALFEYIQPHKDKATPNVGDSDCNRGVNPQNIFPSSIDYCAKFDISV